MSNGGYTHSTSDDDSGTAWDFFLSSTQPDRPWAEWIAWTFEEAGYRVLIQAWDLVPGPNWATASPGRSRPCSAPASTARRCSPTRHSPSPTRARSTAAR
ncbi:toll/interleukin-1 receptor domain-containing protein [Frankia sp. Cpl3]|nr:toll/interleukin-1 receptor domain-containing protein [Parafrankia colletiae]MCK9904842.1 toll/interleukin-1 receptor domain-containing protein [Frankia sp. Cpl3]